MVTNTKRKSLHKLLVDAYEFRGKFDNTLGEQTPEIILLFVNNIIKTVENILCNKGE